MHEDGADDFFKALQVKAMPADEVFMGRPWGIPERLIVSAVVENCVAV